MGKRDIGGICSFVGLVREMVSTEESTNAINTMTLEHYPGMTERALKMIEAEALELWPLAASLIIHRYGKLSVNCKIVLVACFSEHRKDSFESCNYIMDYLKKDAPFWKNEFYEKTNEWLINSN